MSATHRSRGLSETLKGPQAMKTPKWSHTVNICRKNGSLVPGCSIFTLLGYSGGEDRSICGKQVTYTELSASPKPGKRKCAAGKARPTPRTAATAESFHSPALSQTPCKTAWEPLTGVIHKKPLNRYKHCRLHLKIT